MSEKDLLSKQDGDDYFHWMRDDYLEQLIDKNRPIIREIPDWFNLKLYEPLRSASKECCYEQLIIRKTLIFGLSAGVSSKYLGELISHLKNETRKCGIVDLEDKYAQFLSGGAPLTTMKGSDKERKEFARPVQRLTPLAAIHRLLNLNPRSRFHAFKCVEDYFYGHSDFVDFYIHLNQDKTLMNALDSFQSDSMINLQIDPYASLPSILEQVKTTVKAEQIKLKRLQKFSSEKVYELGVLPFLDLAIWSLEEGKRLPYSVMASKIFGETSVKGESHMEQTTIPKALELLSADYLRRFHREIYS